MIVLPVSIVNAFLAILFILVFSLKANAQVLNIDRENGQDTLKSMLRFTSSLSFSSDKQKSNLIDVSNSNEFDFFTKKNQVLILLAQTEFSYVGKKALENNGYFQARFRDNDTRQFYPDFFIQYQWNGIQGMEYRRLGGCNLRLRWLEKKRSDLYTNIGLFYESEKWNPFLTAYSFAKDDFKITDRNLVRLNTSAKFAIKLGEKMDISGSMFIQFPINSHFLNPRWFTDCNLNFDLNKHVSFLVHYDHNFDTYRPLPIEKYYYNLITGIQLKF